MTTKELRDAVTRRPFTPFKVVMADGTRYNVPLPEWILYPKPLRLCTVISPNDTYAVLDLLTMTGLEYAGEPTPAAPPEPDAEAATAAA